MPRILLILIISLSTLIGCKTFSPTQMFDIDGNYPFNEFTKSSKDFIIKPFDQLEILMATNDGQILLEQTFTTDLNNKRRLTEQDEIISYMVGRDSLVKIPTLGRYKLGGLSIRAAEDSLENAFKQNFQNPFVKIKITNRKVLIFFEEGTEGKVISLPEENMTLFEAIAHAGGLSKNSKAYRIKLIRGDNKNPQIFNYNIRSIEEFRKADLNLEANDIIYVDSKPRYLNKLIVELQPYLVLLSSSILIYSIFAK